MNNAIEKNLQSIFEQSYTKWRIIYINDNAQQIKHTKNLKN